MLPGPGCREMGGLCVASRRRVWRTACTPGATRSRCLSGLRGLEEQERWSNRQGMDSLGCSEGILPDSRLGQET